MSLITNKKAYFDFEITDTYSAGLELFGFEVKSLRKGQGSLEGSYVTVRGSEAYLIGSFIPPFQEKNAPVDFDPRRNRKLLLTSKEIDEIGKIEKTKGLTIVPISVYNKGGVLKVDLGVGKGKKKHDKRETLKKQSVERENRREFVDR
ncbi:MAG: ssrA-binding protein [Parcubacteria group bacterium Gr01-1014_46]|nr:MAG: ssrA-binding protein [Parcubacteria group bacterium Gr01-1014_46]